MFLFTSLFVFFFQAEDGIRDGTVTGVQTCALPISADPAATAAVTRDEHKLRDHADAPQTVMAADAVEIDTTRLSLDGVISRIVGLAQQRVRVPPRADAVWTR